MDSRGFLTLMPFVLMALVALTLWLRLQLRKSQKGGEFSEGKFRKMFETNFIGYVITDAHSKIIDANDYYLNLLGLTREDLNKGVTWSEVQGVATPFEKEYVLRDGSRVWVLIGATKYQDLIVSYILNISDRKQAAKDLCEAKSRLEENVALRTKELLDANRELSDTQNFLDSVIENIPNMIFVKDAEELRFVRMNRAGEDLLGYSRLDLLGKNDYDFFPKDQADFFTNKDREVLAGGGAVDIAEEPIQTKDGPRELHTKKIPILDKQGNAIYLLGISEDITERKRAEKRQLEFVEVQAARAAAERSNKRLQFLAEASGALNESLDIRSLLNSFARVIVENMADWCVIDLYDEKSHSIDRMVATASNGHVPQEIKDWWQQRTLDINAPEGIGFVIRTGKSRIYNDLSRQRLQAMYADATLIEKIVNWDLTSSLIVPLSYHGKVLGTLCFINAESQVKYDDFDLSIAQDLAKRAALAIENARLYTKASEASRAKSAFLANISHEIRTPLGAMLGFAELTLDEKNLNEQQQSYISTIARNGRQLLRLVDEILDLSKVESDRIQIEQLSFSLPALLHEVYGLMKIKADEKGVDFVMRGIESLPERVKTDPLRLRQILFNVIGNSFKFTEQGSITVAAQFKAEKNSRTKGALEIVISDTGIGMTDEQSLKIFQPFVQADGTMTRKYGGTGLGLFLSRKLARLLGGDVILRKTLLNRGSEFAISLAVEIDSTILALAPDEAKPANGDLPVKVLLVDDSADNRMLISAFLHRPGINLDLAENGAIGVDKAMHNHYDLVLMDIQMPEMDGYEAIKVLGKKGYKGPVVALTAHAMKGDRERCLRAGFHDYLCKPVTRKSLMDMLGRYAAPPPSAASLH